MSNVFLTGLNNEHRSRLALAHVPCYDLELGQEYGLMVESQHLETALNALGAYIESQTASGFEGIVKVVLKAKVAAQPEQPKKHKVTNDWKGGENEELTQAARQFLMPVIDREVHLHNRGGYHCEPVNDGKFHIHISSSAKAYAEPGAIPPETIWGFANTNRAKAFLPSGRGVVIADEASQYAVAELVGDNNLFVHFNLLHQYDSARGRIFRVLMQKLAHLVGLASEDHRRLMRQRFVEECSKSIVRVVRDTTGDDEHESLPPVANGVAVSLESNSRFGNSATNSPVASGLKRAENGGNLPDRKARIQALRKQISQAIAATRAKERKLLTDESVDVEEFGLEYDNLMKVKSVKDVKVEHDTIVILTDILNCKDERSGIYHEIGAFKIQLPMNGTSPLWTNLTRRVTGMKEDQHAPHIWSNGTACLGNTQDIFPKLFAQRQWSIAAQLAIEFVQAANTSDAAGKHINRWPRATGR